MTINDKISLQKFLPLSDAEIQGLLHPAQAGLCGFSHSTCPQYSLKTLLLLNPMFLLKYILNCE
jgi:hypothetical protein